MKKYFYSYDEKRRGPFTFEQLKDENIDKDTLVWFEGLTDWKPAKEINELEYILQLTPPHLPITETEDNAIDNKSEEIHEETKINHVNTESFNQKKRGMFSRPFSFEGRIGRTEYGISLIIYFVIYVIIIAIMVDGGDYSSVLELAFIPALWFLLAQGSKRCHDIGKIGLYQIIPFYFFWLIFVKGEVGKVNEYGVNPKY